MNGFLRQSTASQSRSLGPIVSDSDYTPATELTIANTDIKLIVNGAASVDKTSGGGTHRANGEYGVTFDATDSATVGELKVSVKVAGAFVFSATFTVLTQAAYDAQFGSSAPGYVANAPVNVAQISGDATAADNAEAFFDGSGYAGTNNVIPTVTTLTNDPSGVTTLLSRLTATRAGYLDNLSAGAVALASDMATVLARIGAFAGTGVNTILGMFKAVLSKTASTPSDVGGTFDATTDSQEAIRDRGDAAWTTATGFAVPGDAMTLTTPTKESISDTWTARNIEGGSNGGRTNGQAIAALRNKVEVDALGAGTVYDKTDGNPLWTFNATRTPGDPISAVDPT